MVGTWAMALQLHALPSLALLHTEELGGETIPRSVQLATLEGVRCAQPMAACMAPL